MTPHQTPLYVVTVLPGASSGLSQPSQPSPQPQMHTATDAHRGCAGRMHAMLLNCTQTTEPPASFCSRHHALLSQMLSMQDHNMHVKCYKKERPQQLCRTKQCNELWHKRVGQTTPDMQCIPLGGLQTGTPTALPLACSVACSVACPDKYIAFNLAFSNICGCRHNLWCCAPVLSVHKVQPHRQEVGLYTMRFTAATLQNMHALPSNATSPY